MDKIPNDIDRYDYFYMLIMEELNRGRYYNFYCAFEDVYPKEMKKLHQRFKIEGPFNDKDALYYSIKPSAANVFIYDNKDL